MNRQEKAGFCFLIGFFIINMMGMMLLLAAFSFAAHRSLSWVHLPLAVTGAAGIQYYTARSRFLLPSVFLKNVAVIALLLVFAFLVSAYFYDVSYDGQYYHQEMVIQLKEGWNPFYTELTDTGNTSYVSTWLNHYAKGIEVCEAIVYKFSNKIETGKAINVLLLIASFTLCAGFLYKHSTAGTIKVLLLSALLAFNPVVTVQIFTYYIDGAIGMLLLCLLIVTAEIILDSGKDRLYLLGVICALLVNVKFTAIAYLGVFVTGLLLILLYQKRIKEFQRVLVVAAFSTVMAIGFTGFNPYITNTVHHHNPFYPVAGPGKLDILSSMAPAGFINKNRFESFFISLFSHSENLILENNRQPVLKLPFTFTLPEVMLSAGWDTRIGGFGFLFSGIMLLSTLLLVLTLIKGSKEGKTALVFALLVLLCSIFIMPQPWWARFVPQLWFFPFIVLYFSGWARPVAYLKYLQGTLYFLIAFNAGVILLVSITKNIISSSTVAYQLKKVTSARGTVKADYGIFLSNRIKFQENHINYVAGRVENDSTAINIDNIHTLVKADMPDRKTPEPLVLQLMHLYHK